MPTINVTTHHERTELMKRYPTACVYHIGLYLHRVKGQSSFTAKDTCTYGQGTDAQRWFNDHIDPNVLTKKLTIIYDHGFTADEWNNVITRSHTFYFCPTDAMNKCNLAIKQLFRHVMIANEPPMCSNYAAAEIRRLIRTGTIECIDNTRRPFRYRVNPALIDNPDFPED